MGPEATTVFLLVLIGRFVLPLFIPRYPLPAILACLVLDGVDQTIFQSFGFDPPGYQGYDKAMDVYYLSVAYLATMRNWVSQPAFGVARFLFFYRMVGVVVFELSQLRIMLLVFPNTFEYFFIAYEAVRTRWNPLRLDRRAWIGVAAAIWVFVKLPQEYWIHVAQLDLTDTMRDVPWFTPLLVVVLLVLAAVLWFVVRPRLVAPDWGWRIAADPLPAGLDTREEWLTWFARTRVLSVDTLEKVVMVGLLSVIYAEVLPGVDTGSLRLFVGLAVIIVINSAISLWAANRSRSLDSLTAAFLGRVLINAALILGTFWLSGRELGDVRWGGVLFFVLLLSLLTTMHDRYSPVRAVRRATPSVGAQADA
ncbi:MAG TPA: hypothetical protein PLP61_15125 [Nocardioides sp.]|uniref:hypothetical protein n=1 Tax=Nocardioides sp. TaxID=35761 RepID=UPI002C93FAB6|nr:hypothetical protein [Nocardioides sp.]HQR28373.1 hypothetical protein [Nocardioides sp.]